MTPQPNQPQGIPPPQNNPSGNQTFSQDYVPDSCAYSFGSRQEWLDEYVPSYNHYTAEAFLRSGMRAEDVRRIFGR